MRQGDEASLDATADLAERIGVDVDLLRSVLGAPLQRWESDPDLGEPIVTYTGLADPRTPGRPLVAIRLEPGDDALDIGHSVGVSLPNNEMQWSLAEPRSRLTFVDADEVMLCEDMRTAIAGIAEAAMLRGTSW